MLKSITPETLGPSNERDRLVEIERIIARFRWFVAMVGVALTLLTTQTRPGLAWASLVGFILSCAIASVALHRDLSLNQIRALGGFVFVADLTMITLSMLSDIGTPERGVSLALVLVLFEGAVRWQVVGGVLSALGAIASLAVWTAARDAHLGIPMDWASFGFRSAMLMVTGVALGTIVHALDASRDAYGRQVRDIEVISRFAVEAPRRDGDESVQLLADLLHDDLRFGRVVILFHEPMLGILRPVATAGYPPGGPTDPLTDPDGIALDEPDHIATRCFREGTSQSRQDRRRTPRGTPGEQDAVRSELAVPLRAGTRRLGVIVVGSPETEAYGPINFRLLETVAGELAQVLENARLAEVQRRTIDELQRLSAMKDDFIAVTSHELRTPLTALKGFAGALDGRRSALSEEQIDRAAQAISRQVTRLNSLVEDLLAASLIDSGRSLPTPDEIEIPSLLAEIVSEVDPGGDTFAFRTDVAADARTLWADPSFLRRVLVNLLANAVRYSPEGGTVEVVVRRSGTRIGIEVCDEGVGIAPEDISRLFGKFVRLRADHSRGGTGLGLYIVKGLVEAMDGEVEVHSVLGQGSCFSVHLPAPSEPTPDPDDGEQTAPPPAGDVRRRPATGEDLAPHRPPAGAQIPRSS